MKNKYVVYLTLTAFVVLVAINACRKPDEFGVEEFDETYAGGQQTVFDQGSGSFGHEFPKLNAQRAELHGVGDHAFEAPFVTAPAYLNSGLGPVYNNVSCVNCHIGDGRGRPPLPNEQLASMLFRISIPGVGEHGGPNPVPGFGGQLQQRAVYGELPEAEVVITYQVVSGQYDDGTPYQLRQPTYSILNEYQPLSGNTMLSPRVAPPVFGLGLLEAIDEDVLLSHSDPNDVDGDGISGKPNYVWDILKGTFKIGRFGWKCGAPNLLQQTAGAYSEDMGITNSLFPNESCQDQVQYDGILDEFEVSDSLLFAVAFYLKSLAVPARRNVRDPQVIRGKSLFISAQCSKCHIPAMRTGVDVTFPEVSNQMIFPYTDLLLHDMGVGLSDGRPDYDATGQEWRTPALWGIGLTQAVNGHNNFMHDGRAQTLEEAILWHGGEGENSRLNFLAMSAQDRVDLVAFLNSL